MILRRTSLITTLLLAAWAIAIAFASGSSLERPHTAKPVLSASSANGPVAISNSKNGTAILTASRMSPGSSTTGTVTIANTGSVATNVSLAKTNLSDAPAAGPRLSQTLDLRVEDVTNPKKPARLVYGGKLGAMPVVSLGGYAKGESKTYRFTVSFPAGATSGNGLQGASTRVTYTWTAVKA